MNPTDHSETRRITASLKFVSQHATTFWLLALCLVAVTSIAGSWYLLRSSPPPQGPPTRAAVSTSDESLAPPSPDDTVILPRSSWKEAGLQVEKVEPSPLTEAIWVTGKIALNEDRVAHIFPLVSGRVEEVMVSYGQHVRRGDVLALVQSREVGQAKLELVKDRLAFEFAKVHHGWSEHFAKNTTEMVAALLTNISIDEIDRQFRDRPMGNFREQLLTAYAQARKSELDLARLASLSEQGISPGKQLTAAEASRDADRAAFQAWMEQAKFQSQQQLLTTQQTLREAETRVSVTETSLQILGYEAHDLSDIDPAREGARLAHYPIRAPFDGTIVAKDIVLLERVSPEMQLFEIADLSSVWVKADVYDQHLPRLRDLQEETVRLRTSTYPDRIFSARVFYTGEIVAEETRTIALTAIANNEEQLLKPGMFAEVELRRRQPDTVLQIPEPAIIEHGGQTMVFVLDGEDRFAVRPVTLGRRSEGRREVLSGLQAQQSVVTEGTFVLKSLMLKDLIGED
jgi:membrane fusion protein, heavy metal efflux system